MENAIDTYMRLWHSNTDNRDSKKTSDAYDRFDHALSKLGLDRKDEYVLSELNTDVNLAYEEQGFIAGFQIASRMWRDLFEASAVENL